MEYQLVGIPDEKALERPQKLDEIEKVIMSPLKRLDHLLEILKEQNSESVSDYASRLESKFGGLVKKNYVVAKGIDINEKLKELTNLKEYPALAKLALNYLLGELKLELDADWSKEMFVIQRNYLRAFLSSRYYNVLTLTESINRKKAIDIYKKHFERINRARVEESEERHLTIEEFAEDSRTPDPENPGWLRIIGEVENGKVLIRKDTCLWADSMQDFPDSELKFLVCCYGDYTSIRAVNRNFALTMEHSIAGGHDYCDCLIHDLRINDKIEHPSDEFFASIEPTNRS
ncbi:MAG: L-2-amino-thiazoline-4-carboxylic acid hydrolase [Candidatus Thorarchaeota archaeon]